MDINERCQSLPIIHTQKVEWEKCKKENNVMIIPHPIYSEEVKSWIKTFYSLEIADVDYLSNFGNVKQKAISELTRDETLTRITAIVRGEKYCDGRIADALESGELEELCVHLHELTKADKKAKTSTNILLSDLLKNNGIDPKEVVLIRHVMSQDNFNKCFQEGFIKEYTQIQGKNKKMLKQSKYWMVFIGTNGTRAKLYCMYKYKGFSHVSEHTMPEGFPCPDMYIDDANLYELEETELFGDLKDRLIIEWGSATQSWYQSANVRKPIVAIHSQQKYAFEGYESCIYSFEKLKEIVEDMGMGAYEEHWKALSSVKGVYLIVDTTDGKQYIGSAYGDKGILGRWSDYVNTLHGGNKELIKLLKRNPERYKKFRFTILKIFSDGASEKVVTDAEKLYKAKLGSVEFGLNDN